MTRMQPQLGLLHRPLRGRAGVGILAILLIVFGPSWVQAQDQEPTLATRLLPNPIGLGQETILEIRVMVAAMRLLRVQPTFELDNLEIVAGPFREQSMQFVNGAISNSTTLRWRLRPTTVGEGRVTNIRVQVGDQTIVGTDLSVAVQEKAVPEAVPRQRQADPMEQFFQRRSRDPFSQRESEPELHLRAETNPGDPFVGEQVHYTLYLFTRNDVTAVNAEDLPDFEGFWNEEPSADAKPKRAETVTIDGRQWLRVALLERVLYPLRPGELEIDPATMAFEVDLDSSGFFRDRRAVRRTSPAAKLSVRPLPAGGPPNASVGPINLKSTLEPANVEAGQAAQLEVVARGRGNLRRVPDPVIEAPGGVEIYPPQGESSQKFNPNGVQFTRKWRWVVVPDRAGSYQLPKITIPYFDPQTESFAVASTESHLLEAVPAVRAAEPQRRVDRSPLLHPVRMAAVAGLEGSRDRGWGLWLLALAAVGVAMTAFSDLRRGSESSALDNPGTTALPVVAGEKSRRPRQVLQQALSAVSSSESRRTAPAIEAAVRRYLVERWGLPENAAPESWVEHLQGKGLPLAALDRLEKLTEDLYYLRFAPQLSQTDRLATELKNSALEWVKRLPRR